MVATPSIRMTSPSESLSEYLRSERYEALIRVSQAIGAHRDPKDLFSAMATEMHRVVQFDGIVVAQYDEKSNEITAVPKLLEMLSLKGCIVTVDALNCQRNIARQIVDQGGDYALALKGNQGTLHADVSTFLDDPVVAKEKTTTTHTMVDADHGRIETRTATVSTDIAWLQELHQWPGLAAIAKIDRIRELPTKTTTETAYYLLSTPVSAERCNEVVRSHWGIENRLHWRLDVIMNEDQARNRKGNGPYNLAILRHMALNSMQKDKAKVSLRGKFKKAAWDDAYLARLLTQF